MSSIVEAVDDDEVDVKADETIEECAALGSLRSFFLYAGAGSGKTRSLVKALISINRRIGQELRRSGRQVGVITYTNAACEEIERRLKYDPAFHISTIHSFAWSLIGGHHGDIRKWLASTLPVDIAAVEQEQAKGRGGKASEERARKIASKSKRLAELHSIRVFTYNPNGDNFGRDSLSHNEVIDMTADFIAKKPALRRVLVGHYPVLLIDESQDTLLPFIDALLGLERDEHERFMLGLFGDMMQRIYGHGKADLDTSIPERWARPEKVMNHRSRERIVRLGNGIRAAADGWSQRARADRAGGIVRAFVLSADTPDKYALESRIVKEMAEITGDDGWSTDMAGVKVLTLEHHMAASRMGFIDMFDPIDKIPEYRTGLRDGTLAPIRLFSHRVLPFLDAEMSKNRFSQMALLRAESPLLEGRRLKAAGAKQRKLFNETRSAATALAGILLKGRNPAFGDVLSVIANTGLFEIPNVLRPYAEPEFLQSLSDHVESDDQITAAWASFLSSPFMQIRGYTDYLNDKAPYGTHQGIKGLEFPRVLAIIDDSASRFRAGASYEKLFGVKPRSAADRKNESEGKETQSIRTRRLLYVICTRAEESLALVIYTEKQDRVVENLVSDGLFDATEIVQEV